MNHLIFGCDIQDVAIASIIPVISKDANVFLYVGEDKEYVKRVAEVCRRFNTSVVFETIENINDIKLENYAYVWNNTRNIHAVSDVLDTSGYQGSLVYTCALQPSALTDRSFKGMNVVHIPCIYDLSDIEGIKQRLLEPKSLVIGLCGWESGYPDFYDYYRNNGITLFASGLSYSTAVGKSLAIDSLKSVERSIRALNHVTSLLSGQPEVPDFPMLARKYISQMSLFETSAGPIGWTTSKLEAFFYFDRIIGMRFRGAVNLMLHVIERASKEKVHVIYDDFSSYAGSLRGTEQKVFEYKGGKVENLVYISGELPDGITELATNYLKLGM